MIREAIIRKIVERDLASDSFLEDDVSRDDELLHTAAIEEVRFVGHGTRILGRPSPRRWPHSRVDARSDRTTTPASVYDRVRPGRDDQPIPRPPALRSRTPPLRKLASRPDGRRYQPRQLLPPPTRRLRLRDHDPLAPSAPSRRPIHDLHRSLLGKPRQSHGRPPHVRKLVEGDGGN